MGLILLYLIALSRKRVKGFILLVQYKYSNARMFEIQRKSFLCNRQDASLCALDYNMYNLLMHK